MKDMMENLKNSVIIWDNDGTVMGSANPNDTSSNAKVILPNVEKVMANAMLNIICSGCKTPESELQHFDPEKVTARLATLMEQLPVTAATFSPAIGGTQCYVVIKKSSGFEVRKAHEDLRYLHLVGQFKKPGAGMLVVIQDLLHEFGHHNNPTVMIGDTWHDEHAARAMGISFIPAQKIHETVELVDATALPQSSR